MVNVLASSEVDRGFKSPSGKTKDYEIGIFCLSPKHVALMIKVITKLPNSRVVG
jgi:REP element-mobilizing transposase RayT